MARKSINTTIDENLMKKLKLLADAKGKKINEVLEESIELLLTKDKDIFEKYVAELKEMLDTL